MASALISLRLYLLSLGAGLFHCYTPNPSPKSPKKNGKVRTLGVKMNLGRLQRLVLKTWVLLWVQDLMFKLQVSGLGFKI